MQYAVKNAVKNAQNKHQIFRADKKSIRSQKCPQNTPKDFPSIYLTYN